MNKNDKGYDKLWAPWRMEYIEGVDTEHDTGCIFCSKPGEDNDEGNFILYRGTTCFVIMNIYPYNNGHLMVVPYQHTASLSTLDSATRLEIMDITERLIEAVSRVMRPDGFNIGMNLGRSAGAGIDEHLHMHVVPRWNGDTNFMPVIGCTKVISEGLENTCGKLQRIIHEVIAELGQENP